MALTLVGTPTTATVTSSASSTIALPTGTAAGDLALIVHAGNQTDTAYVSGWTGVGLVAYSTSSEMRAQYHTVTSGDVAATTFTIPGSPGFNEIRYVCWTFTDAATPSVDISASDQANPSTSPNTTHSMPSVTTTGADRIVIVATASRPQGTTWSSLPGGVTVDDSFIGSGIAMWSGHFAAATAGATGAKTVTHDVAYAGYVSWTVAVAGASASSAFPTFLLSSHTPFSPNYRRSR